jgi:cytochrome c
MMRTRQIVTTALIGMMAYGIGARVRAQAPAAAPAKPAAAKPAAGGAVARGKYLVTSMGCNDCHTPWKAGDAGPEPDMTRMLSGHPADLTAPAPTLPPGPWIVAATATFTGWSGPWGVSYSKNLTPDKETGLGNWTAQQFVDTIRNGRELGHGRQLLPPMPWPAIRNLNDADLRAIFVYLQSIPAIKNKVPDPIIAAPPSK